MNPVLLLNICYKRAHLYKITPYILKGQGIMLCCEVLSERSVKVQSQGVWILLFIQRDFSDCYNRFTYLTVCYLCLQGGGTLWVEFGEDTPLSSHCKYYVIYEGSKQRHVTPAKLLSPTKLQAIIPGKPILQWNHWFVTFLLTSKCVCY